MSIITFIILQVAVLIIVLVVCEFIDSTDKKCLLKVTIRIEMINGQIRAFEVDDVNNEIVEFLKSYHAVGRDVRRITATKEGKIIYEIEYVDRTN